MNQTLSENRAAAVKNYLIENGIKADRLNSTGFGETKPMDTTKLLQEKHTRRVEISLIRINFLIFTENVSIYRFFYFNIYFFILTFTWYFCAIN
jgi:hypothetical protein